MDPIVVQDREDRKARIDKEKVSSKGTDRFPYRGKYEEFPVVRLSIDLPIYRMENTRTAVKQLTFISENEKLVDYFKNGQENQSAQIAQHNILLEMAKYARAPIYQELQNVAVQRENLLITADGVIINGNRRLAAMRDLYLTDPHSYREFSHVNAAVLPDEATDNDIEEIEAELQEVPETKLEYDWISRRLKLRYRVQVLGFPRKKIMTMYRFRREEDINTEHQQLVLAEEYLERFLGKPGAYEELEASYQIFKDLEKTLRGRSGDDAELRRLIGFLFAKEARKVGDRVYRYNAAFGKDCEKVLHRLAQMENIELDNAEGEDEVEGDPDDPLAGLGGGKKTVYAPLKTVLADQSKTYETARKVVRIYESVREEQKEENVRVAALNNTQKANALLHDIDLSVTDPLIFAKVIVELDRIVAVVQDLKDQIKNRSH